MSNPKRKPAKKAPAMLRRVYTAEPYRCGAMGSLGQAAYMLLRQHNFPDTHDVRDVFTGADSDRLVSWDYNHAHRCFKEHTSRGELGLEHWARTAWPKDIMAFLKDILKVEQSKPGVEWTGFRISGTVNRSNGYPVWTFELFAKHPKSKTKVYSGDYAPNVRAPDPSMGSTFSLNGYERG